MYIVQLKQLSIQNQSNILKGSFVHLRVYCVCTGNTAVIPFDLKRIFHELSMELIKQKKSVFKAQQMNVGTIENRLSEVETLAQRLYIVYRFLVVSEIRYRSLVAPWIILYTDLLLFQQLYYIQISFSECPRDYII